MHRRLCGPTMPGAMAREQLAKTHVANAGRPTTVEGWKRTRRGLDDDRLGGLDVPIGRNVGRTDQDVAVRIQWDVATVVPGAVVSRGRAVAAVVADGRRSQTRIGLDSGGRHAVATAQSPPTLQFSATACHAIVEVRCAHVASRLGGRWDSRQEQPTAGKQADVQDSCHRRMERHGQGSGFLGSSPEEGSTFWGADSGSTPIWDLRASNSSSTPPPDSRDLN